MAPKSESMSDPAGAITVTPITVTTLMLIIRIGGAALGGAAGRLETLHRERLPKVTPGGGCFGLPEREASGERQMNDRLSFGSGRSG